MLFKLNIFRAVSYGGGGGGTIFGGGGGGGIDAVISKSRARKYFHDYNIVND